MKLDTATDYGLDIYHKALNIFADNWDHEPVCGVSVTLSDLQPMSSYQLDLFGRVEQKKKLSTAVDAIYNKYGKTALLHGSSLLLGGKWINRAGKIGGHYK
ncbi:hypothetical protein M3N64_12790 [Sporolactobacillus sp. CPB3-1]|uniref:DNA polymerase Y-family little finger domain-containing protein n=1 Tax=Sporolactobacillus mangiferae TaxID=2940498 RepID=A0ABT0MDP8_9BACL|nr:hypothetical protein [Sporolactobacillus mangiferae]